MANILITGANRGIGLEFARQYGEAGDRVFATCRHPDEARELQHLVERSKGRVTVHALDVTSDESVAATASELANETVDILINNAGMGAGRGLHGRVDYDVWEVLLRVNTIGPHRVSLAFRPHLMKSKKRVIVTLSSVLGSIATNLAANSTYSSSKAAVNRVMHRLATEWRDDGFVIVLLHPGWVKTDMGGPNATLDVEESVAGMRRIMANLQPADSGRFLNHHGTDIPW